jgi:tRNA-splicing ligase RtcB
MPAIVRPNVLSWATDVEENTLDQAARSAAMPFVPEHIALMPDAHWGLGATVGSVIPTEGAIMPAAVGVDIGCGMIAAKTDLTSQDLGDNLDALMPMVELRIPAGAGKAHEAAVGAWAYGSIGRPATDLTSKQEATSATQFGTLGSGNHFVEVCLDDTDGVWVVLHSGSRGIGNQLAQRAITEAKGLMKQYFIALPDPDLAYFVEGTTEFDRYIQDMLWAQRYAMESRSTMMDAALRSLFEIVGSGGEVDRVNCHHNFTQRETHLGRSLWITRKGAIKAEQTDRGVIPGSMGTRSYIVSGKGSVASYTSCSHGAGRRMSRNEARKQLSVESLNAAMAGKAWNADHAVELLDEHPDSYKDIDQVMAAQADLVTVEAVLRQVFNYKGHK